MANVLLAWGNRADLATLAGGSWSATLPLANLQTRQVQKVGRTTGVTLANTQFTADLGAAKSINCVSLVVHNMSAPAKVRVTAASNSGYTSPEYQSAWLDVWPAGVIPISALEWEEDNFWLGTMTAEARAGYNSPFLHILPAAQYLRYWKIEVDDTTNAAGYVQFGRLFMAASWQPQYNMAYGASLGYEDPTEISTSLSGAEYFDVRGKYRSHRFDLDFLSSEEVHQQVFELQRLAGTSSEVLVVPNIDDASTLVQRSFVGRLKSLTPAAQTNYGIFKTSMEIKELL
jgi:hypothetical protein